MSASLGLYAEALRIHAGGAACDAVARFQDGSTRPLWVERWVAGADAVDEHALGRVEGPVLDVGCGPGRHLHALARRGVFGLGVDLCQAAVELARDGGATAIVGSIFGEVPSAGSWRSALLLDGNIGIGGRPAKLLSRINALLMPGGATLVELAPPQVPGVETMVRLEIADAASEWFRWAEVSAADIDELARRAGLQVSCRWQEGGRWFALLRACGSTSV